MYHSLHLFDPFQLFISSETIHIDLRYIIYLLQNANIRKAALLELLFLWWQHNKCICPCGTFDKKKQLHNIGRLKTWDKERPPNLLIKVQIKHSRHDKIFHHPLLLKYSEKPPKSCSYLSWGLVRWLFCTADCFNLAN